METEGLVSSLPMAMRKLPSYVLSQQTLLDSGFVSSGADSSVTHSLTQQATQLHPTCAGFYVEYISEQIQVSVPLDVAFL